MSNLKRGDVFFADFGNKRRPWIVVQNDVGNNHSPKTIVVPLTSKIKKNLPTHCVICWGKIRTSVVHCEEIQSVTIDPRWDPVEHLPSPIMQHINRALKIAIGVD